MDDGLNDIKNDGEIDMEIKIDAVESNSNSTILLLKEGLYLTGYN